MIIFFCIIALLVIAFYNFPTFLEKSHKEMCEKWRKEQLEAGMPEEIVDLELLSHHFML